MHPIMEASIPLEKFAEQIVKNETVKLYYSTGGMNTASPGSLNCSFHWLYSRSKFYTNIIDLLDKELKKDTEAKKDSEENLRALYSLFPATSQYMPKQVNFASVARFNDFSPMVSKTEPTLGQATKGTSQWAKSIMYLCYFLMIIAILACFMKAQFLDVLSYDSGLFGLSIHHGHTEQRASNDLQDGYHLHGRHRIQHSTGRHLADLLHGGRLPVTLSLGGTLSTPTATLCAPCEPS
jgi:hypothetical protein